MELSLLSRGLCKVHMKLVSLALCIYNCILAPITLGCASRVRRFWLKMCGIKIGKSVFIGPRVYFDCRNCSLTIGDNVRIMADVRFCMSGAQVNIGDGVEIQNGVCFYSEHGGGMLDIGDRTIVRKKVDLEFCGGRIIVGSDSEINHASVISSNCGSRIVIGKNVKIAHFVSLKCSTHRIDVSLLESNAGESEFKDINIGDGAWLCASTVILPGVSIGQRCVVAAGAVVTHDTECDTLVAGVPAKVKKSYR